MDMVKFEGIFAEEQTHFMCRADGGVFRAPKGDVEIIDGAAHIRIGATVELVRSPIAEDTSGATQREGASDSSTACIGSVELSCATGAVIGKCSGIRSCP